MGYVVLDRAIATEKNRFCSKGTIQTWYHGKGSGDRNIAFCKPWKRKCFAEKYIRESVEYDKKDRAWNHSYEIIEV